MEDANPFEAPVAVSRHTLSLGAEDVELASLSQRFLGRGVDVLFQTMLGVTFGLAAFFVVHAAGWSFAEDPSVAWGDADAVTFFAICVGFLAGLIVQWTLLTYRGQSVGKIVMGTRILRTSGVPAGFFHVVLLREVLGTLLTTGLNGCFIGYLTTVINALLVFGEDRRCGHDLLAGTVVVRV